MSDGIDYSYHYKKWNPDTPEHAAAMCSSYRYLLNGRLPADRGSRILDVGCGAGFLLLALRELGYGSIQGVDISKEQIAQCQAKQIDAVLTSDTVEFLTERRGTFDLILAFDVLEHMPPPEQLRLTRAIYGALRSPGTFICTVPNANSALAGRYRHIDWTHCDSFTEHSLSFLLHNAGFGEITIEEREPVRRPRLCFIPRRSVFHWLLLSLFRSIRRLEMIAELSYWQGKKVPLSLNLLGTARKA